MSGTPNNADRKHHRLRVRTTNPVDAENALIEAEQPRRERIRVIGDRISTGLWTVIAVPTVYIALVMYGVIDTASTRELQQSMTIAGGIIALCCVAGLIASVVRYRAIRSAGTVVAESRAARRRSAHDSEPDPTP